ncbi:helix-turn-helix domain-containing protein [Segatella intestinalis]|uniref:helix-turn-helix domain-containing protein n=1 Tax=Segatella intestinalis TaxID=3035284 RepID=UPI0023EC4BFF|nr:helix-turn-helix domain-containing protein [Prevotella sp. B2-R-102]MDF4240825.1 helix-turn-helix domain-containing protein [Prevotella sp. B2-R-102]
MMDFLYFLQFACFIFMLINALILGITHLHMKWVNRRYEWSRWLILAGMTGLAIQYLLQMLLGFRAKSDDLGAVFNILVYTPCFTTISMGIYNIEATHANRRKMNIVCTCIYAAIIAVFCIGYSNSGSLNIGNWLYAMLVLFGANVAYCIYMIMIEMRKRKKMLELMTGDDMLPYVQYARASIFVLFFSALTMPFAILSTTLLYIIGPLALLSILFFNLSFVALGYNYVPTEELLDKEEEESAALADEITESSDGQDVESADSKETLPSFSQERQAAIKEKLDKWCEELGYKDTTVNMFTLSRSLNISKNELSRYFTSCLNSTFRIWLAEVRFEAAKKMMLDYPDYNNDIISAECGFSSRSYLYRIFKEKEGCSPTVWRAKIQ